MGVQIQCVDRSGLWKGKHRRAVIAKARTRGITGGGRVERRYVAIRLNCPAARAPGLPGHEMLLREERSLVTFFGCRKS